MAGLWNSQLFLVLVLAAFGFMAIDGSICQYPGTAVGNKSDHMAKHIFNDSVFWKHFRHQVKQQSWKCNFPSQILYRDLEKDAKLYSDDTIFRNRRHGVSKWMSNDSLWIDIILGACQEIANGEEGIHSQQLKKLHLLEALDDFVEHLNCFYTVASKMASKGHRVKPLSQDSSRVHDIDKLDPIMLVGYSERFEDNQTTSVWNECVDRHTHINPHHQAHCIWHKTCCNETACAYCEDLMEIALSEMICDKVSRRLQKNLNGVISDDMWNVEEAYFKGLPQTWLDRAFEIIKSMK